MYGVCGSTARYACSVSRTLQPVATVDSKSSFSSTSATLKNHKKSTGSKPWSTVLKPKNPLPSRPAPSDKQFELFTDHVESLVKKSASPPPGWKHRPTSNGEFKRLASQISSVKAQRADSLNKIAFLYAEEGTKDSTLSSVEAVTSEASNLVLEPGSFVELRRASIATNAVVLGYDYIDRKQSFISLTTSGEVWAHTADDVLFDVPNFVSANLASRCGSGSVASDNAELAARVEVLKNLRVIQKDCEDAINVVASRGLDVYGTVRRKDDETKWGETSVSEVARLLLPNRQPTLAHIFAAHKYLASNPLRFVISHDYGTSKRFDVRPLADVKRYQLLNKWTREGDEERRIEAFIQKAKEILKQTRTKSRLGAPTKEINPNHTWSPSDVQILTFLVQSLRPQYRSQQDPFFPIVQAILKRIYEGVDIDIFDHTVHQFLLDIGAVTSWQNLTELRENMGFDLDGTQKLEGDDIVQRSFDKYRRSPHTPVGQILGPEDFYHNDIAEAIRHDFGDMPVYVIDDVGAKELDDGLSIEPIHNEPSTVWVHIHVADPSSLLPPTHILAKQAEARTQSTYFLQTTHSMLPKSLTHHPTYGLSLGCLADSSEGKAQPTLTFSLKFDTTSGTILDYLVRPGLIRKLVIASYEAVDAALGIPTDRNQYPFGGKPAPLNFPSLSERATEDLKLLYQTSQGLVRRRHRDNVFTFSRSQGDIYNAQWPDFDSPVVWDKSLQPSVASPYPKDIPVHTYSGFPSLSYRVATHDGNDLGSRSLVAEMMKLGSRTASMFARDHNIPMIRRWANPPIIQSEKALAEILDARTNTGYIKTDNAHLMKYIVGESIAGYSTDLREHWGLGISADDGYSKATSPLRRYADMIVHWQLKHAMVYEHAVRSSSSTGPSLLGVNTSNKVLFSKEWLDDFAIHNGAAERLSKRTQGQHQAWWNVAWLMKWIEAHNPTGYAFTSSSLDLGTASSSSNPGPFQNLVATLTSAPEVNRDTRKWQAAVNLDALGVKAILVERSEQVVESLWIGDKIAVDVSGMRLGVRPQVQVYPRRS
ncbi:hypothetical protein D9757_009329 [Collybiopsis confluens]|uniref:RNB domain-containing protein n=1 Tax=Collybiopsis confluens TaxID=2823264 RepID=A0A8H5H437_9AGAR|nr:hypothetical protein D9757_009329 [Collybiopsis confluens]